MATAKKRIEFKNLNVSNLITYMDNASAGKFNHTFDITATSISCRAFPQDRKFIKYTGTELINILQFTKLPENFESIKVPIHKMDKLKTSLNVISDASVDEASGYIDYETDEKNGGLVATTISFKGKGITTKIKATDILVFSYVPEERFMEFCNTDGYKMKFNIDKELRNKINTLFSLNGDKTSTFSLRYNKAENKVILFSSDVWEYVLEDVEVKSETDFAYDIPNDSIVRMILPLYTVYITTFQSGKTVMKTYCDEHNIMVNEIVVHDPNKQKVN